MKNAENSEITKSNSNFGFTKKRQFLVYLTDNVSIKNNKIVFKNRIVTTGHDRYNFYEHFPEDFHIFIEFQNILKNKKINDIDICTFIKKYGYLFYDENYIEVAKYNILIHGLVPNIEEYSVNKKLFTDELYIFNNIVELYNLIGRYNELKNTTVKALLKWNITKKRLFNYLTKCCKYEQEPTKKLLDDFDFSSNFIFTEKNLDKMKDYYSMLLNYHLENSRIQALEYKSQFISVTVPKDLIGVIYLDYFNYITEKGENKKVKICKQCGNAFYITFSKNSNIKIFCSNQCKNKYHSNTSNNKNENKIKSQYYKKLYYSPFSSKTSHFLDIANELIEQYRNGEIKSIKEYESQMNNLYHECINDTLSK